jgi:WD40 repeat protein
LGHIISVVFSPDGRYVLSGSWDNTIRLWDVTTGREIKTFSGHSNEVRSVAFNPDGRQVLSGSDDNTVKLWDVATGREIRTFSGHEDAIYSVAFSPNGRQVLSGSNDNTVKLWDTATGREIRTFFGHSSYINSVVFSPNGKQVLSGSDDNTIKLWDATTGREIRTFSGHEDDIYSVAFSPNGRQVLSGSRDNTIKLWDVATGRRIRTFSGHSSVIYSVAFSPDGKQVLSGSWDDTIKLWDASTGREIRTFSGQSEINSVAFSPDGRQVLSGSDCDLVLWDVATGREIITFSGRFNWVRSIAFSPDGRQVLSGFWDNTIKLWDASTGREIRTFSGHSNDVLSVAFSPDSRQVLSGSRDNTIKLWDAATGSEIRTFSGHSGFVRSVAFSPDGKQILSGSTDRSVKLWDISSGVEVKTFSGHSSVVMSVAFSPNGKQVLSGSWDNTIRLWDTDTGREIRTFSGHSNGVNSVAFSPDSRQVLSGSDDNTIKLWEAATGKEIAQFISFTGSDTQLVAASRALTVETQAAVSSIEGEWICITPDGYYAASPQGDRYLNVRVGNKVTGMDSFRDVFYNPDVVEARLAGRPDPALKRTASIQDAEKFFPSTITLQTASTSTTGTANLAVNITDDNQPVQTIKIFVNGNLVGKDELNTVSGQGLQAERASITVTGNQKRLSFNIPLTLDPGENLIEVVSHNGDAESRQSTNVNWQTAANYRPALPNLWILAVGVNQYNDTSIKNLNFCANDAREIVNSFKAQEGKRYAKVNTLLVADGENLMPTAKNIRDSLAFLDRAGPRDIILLFLAGHGMNGKDGAFNFLPSDAALNRDGSMTNIITGDEIAKVLETPGKRLIFIDACHSGGIDNNRMTRRLMNTNAYVFTSSKGNELSLEMAELRHGVFTYSIMDTMRKPSARTAGSLSVLGLSGNVSIDVPRRTNNQQNPVGYSLGFYDFIIGE